MDTKRRTALILLALLCLLLPGCGFLYQEETPAPVPSQPTQTNKPANFRPVPTATPTPAPTPTPRPENQNLLTGEFGLTPEAIGKRPVAVMVNNIFDALPQYGISEADLIFELPVEAGITRLMAVYGDYTQVPQVCSVRSCRYYFPILAAGYDAYYVHWGQDETIATEVLNRLDLDRMDGMADTYGLFYRDQDRAAEGYAYEHTGAFNGPGLMPALIANGVRTDLPVNKSGPFFDFADTPKPPEGAPCTRPQVNFSEAYYSGFEYNAQSDLYYKSHSGSDHRDQRTGQRLAFTNLFLLETEITQRDTVGRVNVDWKSGTGWYVSMGAACPIKWEKDDEYSNLVFYGENGARLRVNPGKSYISFSSPNTTNVPLDS